jgi:hypothetical protein
MLSNKVSTGRPRWPTPLGLYAPAKGVNSTRDGRTCPLRPYRQYLSLGHLPCGVWTSLVPCKRHPGASRTCWSPSTNSPSGSKSDPYQHRVRAGGGVLYKYHPLLWDPKLHHHRQWHAIHSEKVPRLLRRPPHSCGLDRRSSPNDKWAGGARQ